ncbi:MAG: NAD(P)H-dependent glycerol-3-phosphate dehydrogenase, partial [Clostridia bacterium]
GKRLSEVAIECGLDKNNIAVWLGPGHIQEFVKGTPNCMTIDSYNQQLIVQLVEWFHSPIIRFYYGNDMIGNEIGGATKNIIGIAAGMLDGCGYSSLKGPLMSRGVREVSRLVVALGGHEQTAYGLTHLGDYETTLFSKYSNNRSFGEKFIKGENFEKLAEGVMTTKAVVQLAKTLNVDMPITQCVYNLLFEKADPEEQLKKLFDRNVKHEF